MSKFIAIIIFVSIYVIIWINFLQFIEICTHFQLLPPNLGLVHRVYLLPVIILYIALTLFISRILYVDSSNASFFVHPIILLFLYHAETINIDCYMLSLQHHFPANVSWHSGRKVWYK